MRCWTVLFLLLSLTMPLYANDLEYSHNLTITMDDYVARMVRWDESGTKVWVLTPTTLSLWDATTGELLRQTGDPDGQHLLNLLWATGDKQVVAYGGDTIELWDTLDGSVDWETPVAIPLDQAVWNHTEDKFAIWGYETNSLQIYDAVTGTLLFEYIAPFTISSVKWSLDDAKLLLMQLVRNDEPNVTGVQVLDVATQSVQSDFLIEDQLRTGDWGANNTFVAVAGKIAYMLDTEKNEIRTRRTLDDNRQYLAWEQGHERVVVFGNISKMLVWDMVTGDVLSPLNHPVGKPYDDRGLSAEWSPDGRHFASLSYTRVAVWNMETTTQVLGKEKDYYLATQARWSPDGSQLAVSFRNFDIALYDIPSGELRQSLIADDYGVGTASMSFLTHVNWNPDQTQLLVAQFANDYIPPAVWNTATGEAVTVLSDPEVDPETHRLRQVEWNPLGDAILITHTFWGECVSDCIRITIWRAS